jgi:hypothetical protein
MTDYRGCDTAASETRNQPVQSVDVDEILAFGGQDDWLLHRRLLRQALGNALVQRWLAREGTR